MYYFFNIQSSKNSLINLMDGLFMRGVHLQCILHPMSMFYQFTWGIIHFRYSYLLITAYITVGKVNIRWIIKRLFK